MKTETNIFGDNIVAPKDETGFPQWIIELSNELKSVLESYPSHLGGLACTLKFLKRKNVKDYRAHISCSTVVIDIVQKPDNVKFVTVTLFSFPTSSSVNFVLSNIESYTLFRIIGLSITPEEEEICKKLCEVVVRTQGWRIPKIPACFSRAFSSTLLNTRANTYE